MEATEEGNEEQLAHTCLSRVRFTPLTENTKPQS
jgi:hypothetical protein